MLVAIEHIGQEMHHKQGYQKPGNAVELTREGAVQLAE